MKNLLKLSILAVIVTAGIFLFQAQDFNNPFDDNNPLIDRPTRESYSHFHNNTGQSDIITDATGFDNFEMSTDFYEQHMSSNPINPLWIFFGVNAGPQNARNSTDGGLTWALVNPSYPGGTCCDPWSAYLSNGKLIYGSGVSGQYVYTSTNNGNTWTAPVLSVSGVDRNTLAAELTGTGPYAHYVYAAITPGNFARSTNQGVSWTTTYSSANGYPGVMIAVGPNGATNGGCVVYVTNNGTSSANVSYTFHRSLDGGATFSVMTTINVAGYVGTLNASNRLHINFARTRPYPMIAMDNSNGPYRGRVYLVYASNVPAGNGNKPDIKLQYSTDQGATWSAYVVVNDNASPELSDQWFPAIWCEPTTGKLYIKWYDDRNNPSGYGVDVYATSSTTGGTSFVTNQKLTTVASTFPCPSCVGNSNCYRGDYDGITANKKTSFSVWADHRNCGAANMGAYFPDYAMRIRPTTINMNGINDSQFVFVSIPAVKLYADTVMFSAQVLNPPGTGTMTLSFIDKTNNGLLRNLLVVPPMDSVRLRIKTSGGVPVATYNITVKSNGPNGTPVHTRALTIGVVTGISNYNNEIPENFYLYQNFPNPFNPTTNIRFDLAKAGLVKIIVYDITGKQVNELVNGTYEAGKYEADFDASSLSSGIYFYRLETPDFVGIKKMILVK